MLCMVSKMLVIGTPSAFAFSRSTSMLYCGTPVLKVVDTPASSGRWLAAWIDPLGRLGKALQAAAGAVLEVELEAAGGAQAR